MRRFLMTGLAVWLTGCSSIPNEPSSISSSQKSPKDYALCVFPKWQKQQPATTLSETRGHYRIVIASKVMADEVLDVYKTKTGTKASLYQRVPFSLASGGRDLEKAVRECL